MQTVSSTLSSAQGVMLSVAQGGVATDFRRLVFEQYHEREWLNPADYPDGVVVDEFDAGSEIIVIQSADEIVAGMRIVRDVGMGFPHEHELKLNQLDLNNNCPHDVLDHLTHTPRGKMAEITKVVGKRKQRMLTLDIVKGLYWYALRNDIDVYVVVIDMEFFLLCNRLGVPIDPIGTPVYCEGSWTIPAITIPSRYPNSISQKNPSGWSYIATQDNLDETLVMH